MIHVPNMIHFFPWKEYTSFCSGDHCTFFGVPITNSLVMTWVAMALIFIFVFFVNRRIALVPGKLQASLEWAVEGGLSYMKETLENEKLAERFFH